MYIKKRNREIEVREKERERERGGGGGGSGRNLRDRKRRRERKNIRVEGSENRCMHVNFNRYKIRIVTLKVVYNFCPQNVPHLTGAS